MGTKVLAALLTAFVLGFGIYYGFVKKPESDKTEWQVHEAALASMQAELEALSKSIAGAQGRGTCEADTDCRVVGLGARFCGNFGSYLVYSRYGVDEPQLLSLVEKFNVLHEKRSKLSLKAESCGVAPAPVRCIKKRCAAGAS